MDQQVAQLLAERLGVKDTAALQSSDLSSVLTSRFSDPLMAALVNSMLQNSARAATEKREDHEQHLARAQATIRKLKQDLEAADTMARYIADVFGTCQACWGLNHLCTQCQGNSKPGSRPPMEDELLAWVGPALTKLGLRVVRIE